MTFEKCKRLYKVIPTTDTLPDLERYRVYAHQHTYIRGSHLCKEHGTQVMALVTSPDFSSDDLAYKPVLLDTISHKLLR